MSGLGIPDQSPAAAKDEAMRRDRYELCDALGIAPHDRNEYTWDELLDKVRERGAVRSGGDRLIADQVERNMRYELSKDRVKSRREYQRLQALREPAMIVDIQDETGRTGYTIDDIEAARWKAAETQAHRPDGRV